MPHCQWIYLTVCCFSAVLQSLNDISNCTDCCE